MSEQENEAPFEKIYKIAQSSNIPVDAFFLFSPQKEKQRQAMEL